MSSFLKSAISNSWIELAARWILGLTFVYASSYKILSPEEFAKIIYGYDLFPAVSINLIAIILPFLELIAGLALIFGIYPRSAAIIINGLLLAFIVVLSFNLIRGHEFHCGCFSAGEGGHTETPEITIVRDIIYFILGLQVILFGGIRRKSIKRLSP
ncbi:MAG: MauE/DoxX family redox-associated membrane protein [Desulfobacterales bacterium]